MFFGQLDGTGFEVLDPRFEQCIIGHARVERLWTGARWSEGPSWFAAGRFLAWSDIPNNRILRYDECSGAVAVFRQPSNNANGNTVDGEGRLITCEHLTRRVTRTEHDGTVTVLSDSFNGKRLNSPNDVVVKSDGSIWFTDPSYGILFDYEGKRDDSDIGHCNVYRIDPATGETAIVAGDFEKPNGLAFSPDESILYIADTGVSHRSGALKHIRKLEVKGNSLGDSQVFATCTAGVFDGFRVDAEGRLWASAADGVHCFDPDGSMIGKIRIPELVANLCFGGPRLNRLFICGTTSLYSVYLAINGQSPFHTKT
jgi:gluconolactonase